MTTLVLDEKTEQMPIGTVIRTATDSVVEIRDEQGGLVATLMFPVDDDDFDYEPYLAEAQQIVEEYQSRPRDGRPPLTTKEFRESLQRLGPAE